jgi:hypothetical protein
MDETQVTLVPLVPGVHEDIDRTLAPPGTIVRAENIRLRKAGIAKRNALVDAGLVQQDDTTIANVTDALGFAAGRQILVSGGRAYARQRTGDKWQEIGRASRARPVATHWQGFPAANVTSATNDDYIVYAEDNGNQLASGVRVYVQDESGIRRQIAEYASRDQPRVFRVGSVFVLTMRDWAAQAVRGVTIHGTTLAISAETLILGTASTEDSYDAAPFSDTHWLFVTQNAGNMEVQLYDTSFSLFAGNVAAINTPGIVRACSVYGITGVGIWIGWNEGGSSVLFAAFSPDLVTQTGAPVLRTVVTTGLEPAFFTQRDATSVWVLYSTRTTQSVGVRFQITIEARTTTLSSAGPGGFINNVRMASRPFRGTSLLFSLWVHTDGGGGLAGTNAPSPWVTNRRYTLVTVLLADDVPGSLGAFLEPELSPDDTALENMSYHLPEVAFRGTTDDAGNSVERGYFPALAVIRTQSGSQGTAASVLYEWETEGGFEARARQILEFGTQALIAGGGLQELPSSRLNPLDLGIHARGSENGFLYAPAIVKAVTAAWGGAGLTPGAQYFGCAVFEYITPDGLRIQSAPSNIIGPITPPDAANDSIEVTVTTAPATEREFASPPCESVLHIYFTTGNGNVFLRATGDSGIPARGGLATSAVTFQHVTADVDMLSHEPLYTDQGDRANHPAPANRFGWSGGGRVAVAGLFNPNILELSKLAQPNETARFTRHGLFRCLLPSRPTGGAYLDGQHIVFSRDGAFTVPVNGNDDKSPGIGQAQQLPSTVGCVDFRSVCVTHLGIGFQSRRGYEILPRGFGEPRLISGPVQESLRGRRVISAAVVAHSGSGFGETERVGERLLVLAAIGPLVGGVDTGVRLVYDLDFERWLSVDPAMAASATLGEVLTAWDGRLVISGRTGSVLRYEDPTNYGPIESGAMSIGLADVRPFGALSRGQVFSLQLLGEIRSEADVTATVYRDGKYSEPIELGAQEVRGTKGDKFLVEWPLPFNECQSIGADLAIAGFPDENGEGLVVHALGVEVKALAGRARVGQDRTV